MLLYFQKLKMSFDLKSTLTFIGVALLICGAAFIGHTFSQQDSLKTVFDEWKQQHKMVFNSESQNFYRFGIFKQNYLKINAHNQNQGAHYQMGLNQFSALTEQEFKHQFLLESTVYVNTKAIDYQPTADQVDWIKKGAVTPIKNMGQCAASSAFSVTPPIQALSWLKNAKLTSYSQQYLLDCCGNSSCRGGFSNVAGYYTCVSQKGIANSSRYPYVANVQTCKTTETDFKISGFKQITGCDNIAKKLADSPITVFVDASKWIYYKSGVMKCDPTANINHIVSIVAVNTQAWTLKNQWGTSWGQQGFIRLALGNSCGVCQQGYSPYL